MTRFLLEFLVRLTKPYIRRELPGWGLIYRIFIGGYSRDALWSRLGKRVVVGKTHGFRLSLDLGKWADRSAFFLERWYDLPTQLFLRDVARPSDCIVDIGANRGMFSLCASRAVGPTGQVLAFEPNRVCIEILLADIESNSITNIHAFQTAFGERSEERLLYVPKINTGEASLGGSKYQDVESKRVSVVQGDKALQGVRVDLIKIDIEGFEVFALKGLRGVLSKYRPIVLIEVVEEHLRRCSSSPVDLYAYMSELGYVGYRLTAERLWGKYEWRLKLPDVNNPAYDMVWLDPLKANEIQQKYPLAMTGLVLSNGH